MKLDTVIFDMDGLLIDSEPYWQEAGARLLEEYGILLTDRQQQETAGLRTSEWIGHWFARYSIDPKGLERAKQVIEEFAIEKIRHEGKGLPGVDHILSFFKDRDFKIGIASSSPIEVIDVVIDKLNIRGYLDAVTSADGLLYGKPHPEVFILCVGQLHSSPEQCVCFEDSFNGMKAARSAGMKCVVVPAPAFYREEKWSVADLKLHSMSDFNEAMLVSLEG